MKLSEIFGAREAWAHLVGLRMPPHTAYRLLKYAKRVDSEYAVIERQRSKLICDAAGVAEGEPASVKAGTPEHARVVEEFGAVMETESDLKPFNMTLNSILDLASKEQANLLSARDLGQLEPFFEVPKEDAS